MSGLDERPLDGRHPLGLRDPRRPAQRRQVDVAQHHPRHQGHDRLGQAPDDAHRRSAACSPDPTPRSCSSTRRASTSRDGARASGSTTRPPTRSAGSTSCAWSSTPSAGIGRGDEFIAKRVPQRHHRRRQQDRPGQARAGARAARRRRPSSSTCRSTSRCRPRPARASPSSSSTWSARLPEGPQFYPDDMVTDVPEAFWVAELVREQLFAVDPRGDPALDRHPGDRVGVAADPLRDPRGARLAEGDGHREEGRHPQAGRASPCASSSPRAPTSSCT